MKIVIFSNYIDDIVKHFRFLVVFIGALCVAVSFLIAKIKGPMSQVNKQ